MGWKTSWRYFHGFAFKGLRNFLQFQWWPTWLRLSFIHDKMEQLASVLWRLGIFALLVFFSIFLFRIFMDDGYVVQPFSVPKVFVDQGYESRVVALRIQDELQQLKEIAGSVKQDSVTLKNLDSDINLAVMGVGVSIRSLANQLKELLGKPNKILGGEITVAGQEIKARVRMTGFPVFDKEVNLDSSHQTIETLFSEIAKGILFHTDPYRMALVYRKEGNTDEAIEAIRYMIRTRPADAKWAYMAWGSILHEQGQIELAISKYEKSLELDPAFTLALANAASLYSGIGESAKAINYLEKVIHTSPQEVQYQSSLAWLYYGSGQEERADSLFQNIFQRAQIVNQDERMILVSNWVEMKLQKNDIAGAKQIMEHYVNGFGENMISYLVKGIMAFTQQDTSNAFRYIKQAYELDPTHVAAIMYNINGGYMIGKYEYVTSLYEQINWDDVPANAVVNAWNKVAMSYNNTGKHEEAYKLILKAIERDTAIAYPYTTLAETYAFKGQMDSFCHYIGVALEKGFGPENFNLSEKPYSWASKELCFEQLIARYGNKRREKNK
ncbi:MAG: tetratricopeptide repeat protein [Saprospiraceae bacterium]